jgi:transcriptional regulator with XRE-family HTH domain
MKRPDPNPPQPQSLEDWRWMSRLKQREAAQLLGIHISYYSRLERRQVFPHRMLAKTISARTGVPVANLLDLAS